jgi:hypothetical protein
MAKNTKPKTIQLLRMYGSDVNGGEWQWSAELERDAAGQIWLALVPTVDEGVEIESPDPVAISDGAGLFDQLGSLWSNYPDGDISEDQWAGLAAKVSKLDKALGRGLRARVREEYDPTPVLPTAAELWARRATWERTFTGRAVGYLPQEDIRRIRAVRHFAGQY